MNSNSTARALISVRGPDVTYGVLKLTPQISSRAHHVDVHSFSIRSGNDRFKFAEYPLSRALSRDARNDVIYFTFECDEGERTPHHEIDFEINGYDEVVSLRFRAVERDGLEDMLFFEVEDPGGDWMPVEDVLMMELLDDSFMRILEMSIVENLSEHNLDILPMDAES